MRVSVLPSAVRSLCWEERFRKDSKGLRLALMVTNGAGLCYLVRCVGTHQVPLDRIAYLEAAFQHPAINLTASQTDSPDSSVLGDLPPPAQAEAKYMVRG